MNKYIDKIILKIRRKLLNQRWLNKINLSYDQVNAEINSSEFRNNLSEIINNNNYSSQNALSLCGNLLNSMTKFPPEDWINYIYQYVLNKSFHDATTIELREDLNPCCEVFLKFLEIICDIEKESTYNNFKSKYPLLFLTKSEEQNLENPYEYKRFIRAFKQNNVYELMKLSEDLFGYNTLDHICGVHYTSLFLARQLKNIGIPIDLGRISGAAAGHDIGKYGCKGLELKRVPHLHYYYTDVWFKNLNINYIRNIALNHSTWDLELENLSLESLILIYSDFRVKNKTIDGIPEMNIYTLSDSFDVILNKLENVDENKIRRYKKVYAKLHDFEDYLINLGIQIDVNKNTLYRQTDNKSYALMNGNEIVENIKYLSIDHNINLMYKLRDEYSLGKILEVARSESDWKNLREYIRVFEEYSTYLTQNQKLQTLNFLYENLIHPEDDIRRHCAELIGILIASFDREYRKELPPDVKLKDSNVTSIEIFDKYLNMLIYPDQKLIQNHRLWIGYSTRIMINSLFKNCKSSLMIDYRNILIKYFRNKNLTNRTSQLFLLESVKYIPFISYTTNIESIFDYVLKMLKSRNSTLRISALEITNYILDYIPKESPFENNLIELFNTYNIRSKYIVENMLIYKICNSLKISAKITLYTQYCQLDKKKIPTIFLTNLKSATNWVIKKNQIDLLFENTLNNNNTNTLHTCIHFCNILKVSEFETVRNRAGLSILKLMPLLSFEERNEVAVELLRALEIEGSKFTEYIPKFLGQILLWLKPKELDEILDDLNNKIKISNSNLKSLILKTIGISLSHFDNYTERFTESKYAYENRIKKMVGILLNGLGNYKIKVQQSAISVFGKEIFNSKYLNLDQKCYLFKLIAKKLLTLISTDNKNELKFLSNAAALNNIYRFISDYTFSKGNIELSIPKKIAFFPGTFDPFSLSHKEIATSIRNLGYEVYLSVDEFSWSKKTLPNLLRKNITMMSVSDELDIYIFPDKYSINIANSKDLKKLKELFSNSEVYMVAGSDVVLNASSYKKEPEENSIHTFPHIIFKRGKNRVLKEALQNITNKVEFLTLPSNVSKISSTQIRDYIDENRDISKLIDPLAEQYIYENGFYQKEPKNKFSVNSLWLDIEVIENLNDDVIDDIISKINFVNTDNLKKYLQEFKHKLSSRMIILKNKHNNDEIIAFSTFYWIRSNVLYKELNDKNLSLFIRNYASGRLIFLTGFYAKNNINGFNLEQILINETLSFCISKDYEFAIYKDMINKSNPKNIEEILQIQGFQKTDGDSHNNTALTVAMSNPCIINLNLKTILKEPFFSNTEVKNIIHETRRKLISSISSLYPGNLVLCYDSDILYQSLIKKICYENQVPTKTTIPRKLGEAMCVPYGDILDGYVVANTVTKSLHTEKLFNPEVNSFKIGEFPHYLDLENQVSIIKSFEKPVILVDTILHKGYRISALSPLFNKNDIKIKKILVGILSGRGKDIMDKQNIDVDSVYFIPKLNVWFNESDLYPFIGGDSLWRGKMPIRNLIPSLNTILPYNFPVYIKNTGTENIYNLSKVCLENSLEILKILESTYHQINLRNLNLSSMGQVFTAPRCPEHGKGIEYDLNKSPSYYLKNDLELLNRLKHLVE